MSSWIQTCRCQTLRRPSLLHLDFTGRLACPMHLISMNLVSQYKISNPLKMEKPMEEKTWSAQGCCLRRIFFYFPSAGRGGYAFLMQFFSFQSPFSPPEISFLRAWQEPKPKHWSLIIVKHISYYQMWLISVELTLWEAYPHDDSSWSSKQQCFQSARVMMKNLSSWQLHVDSSSLI